jgi:hypothetical protein
MKIAFGIGIVLAVLAAFTVPAMAGQNTMYFTNYSGDTSLGGTSYVEVWLNITDAQGDDPLFGFKAGEINITKELDPSVGAVAGCSRMGDGLWDQLWTCYSGFHDGWWIRFETSQGAPPADPPYGLDLGLYPIANLTIEGNNTGVMDLHFSRVLPRRSNMYDFIGDPFPNQTWEDGTFTCTGPAEIFEKELVLGWNLVSLPLTPLNSSTSTVLGNDTIAYDVVFKYNAASKHFEDVTTSTMDPGTGYFVNVTTAGTWNYTGTAYTSMNVDLKQGLNIVGWLNCSKSISGNLSSIDGNYYYVASWNTTATLPSFETFNPVAPRVFNDFDEMKRGEGYFISMKTDGSTLEGGC